jgi:polyphosphate glucokinase
MARTVSNNVSNNTVPAPSEPKRKPGRPRKELSAPTASATARSTPTVRRSVHPLVLGIDVGGSGIKGAPVDLEKGVLVFDRQRLDTPQPSTPAACTEVIAQLVANFEPMTATNGPVGITYPGVVWDGTTLTAANVDKGWIGLDADAMLEERLKRKVTVLNDAQAAALAEVHFGAGRGVQGMVLMLTFGTGIGSGLVYRGVALPGVEFGHVRMHGRDAEELAAASVKDSKKLSWKAWSERVNDYLSRIEKMLWPELIIIGGGVSEEPEKFLSRLKTRTPVVPAALGNSAGIVGAAMAATQKI